MTIEVNWCRITADARYPYIHHKADGKYPLMFNPEIISHPNPKSRYNICPAFSSVQQYLIRSPYYGSFSFGIDGINFAKSPHLMNLVRPADENYGNLDKPYFQFQVPYLFWSKKEVYLWIEDVPEMFNTNYKNWHIIKGMLPIHKIYRPIHPAIIMKNYNDTFKIEREEPLYSVTLFSPHGKIKLIEKEPSEEILVKSISSAKASAFCPYKWSKSLFSNWIDGVN